MLLPFFGVTAMLLFLFVNYENKAYEKYKKKEKVLELLFPNRTATGEHFNTDSLRSSRKLPIDKGVYSKNDTSCIICRGLSYCSVLNNKLIQEVYLPKNTAFLETCHVIESLGSRMYSEIFGEGKTFRDTAQCRGKHH